MARSTRTRPTPRHDDEPLTREQLLARHAEARQRRNASLLGSEAWAASVAEIGRLEVEIARLEREMDPPRV